jgi:hypothetical protein
MNAKQCKKLRAISGGNTATYEQGTPPRYQNYLGLPVKVQKGIPTKLDQSCPRYLYKQLKKAAKNGSPL